MGKRLTKIYTRTGDKGQTGLGNGNRVAKTHPRIEAIGGVDELNSALGTLIEELKDAGSTELAKTWEFLQICQHRVFDLGGELSIPGLAIISQDHVQAIEAELDALNALLPPLENFILPGGSRLIAQCHMARSICRRAERQVVALMETEAEPEIEAFNGLALEYVNRLSDYLFVVARHCALMTGVEEVLWQKG